jgi:anti-sigma regulatory factor (Ser/Thr protein kinase)
MFRTAVAEIATNVIRHAYPPDSPQGSFQLRLAVTADGLIALFTDGGSAFDASQPREAVDPESLPEGGLGLMVVRAAVDTLEYSRDADAGENTWRLTKLFPDAS